MKNYLFIFTLLVCSSTCMAQKGTGTNNPEASAALDVSSTIGGLLPPRMTEAQRDAMTNLSEGLIIFCTDCNSLQVYNGSFWSNVSPQLMPLNANLQASNGSCDPASLIGSFQVGVDVSANYIDLQVNVLTPGFYTAITQTINGYHFEATGNYLSTGLKTLRLTAVGTPLVAQTDVFKCPLNGNICNFTVTVSP